KDLQDCNDCRHLVVVYKGALRRLDFRILDTFKQFGEDVRHQVMNFNEHEHAKRFGFDEIKLDEYGWLAHPTWKVETIDFRTNHKADKQFTHNYIHLGQGPNGKWTHDEHYMFGGGAGGGFYLSVYSEPLPSRQAALIRGLDRMRERFTKAIDHALKYPNPSNYNVIYMKKVLTRIEESYPIIEEQLTLF